MKHLKHLKLALPLLVVAVVCFGIRAVFATEPTPQERAAGELPDIIREIERTQEYADRNAEAKQRREVLLSCVNHGNCEGF